MSTQTTAITLSTSSYIQNPNGNTVITTGPAVVSPYNPTLVLDFTNQVGTLDSTGTATGNQSSGIFLEIGNVAGAQSRIGNGGGLITGYEYGIFLSSPSVSNSAFVFSSGTIMSRAATFGSGNPDTAGIFAGQGANVTISNAGLIQGGEGVFLQTNDTFTQTVINDAGAVIKGTLSESGNFYGIKVQDNNNGLQGAGSVLNAGRIVGLVDIAAKYAFVTNTSTGTMGTGLFALGTGTLELDAGGSFSGGAHFVDGAANGLSLAKATLLLGGSVGVVGQLAAPGNYTGFGGVTVKSGADWTLGTATSGTGFSGVSTIANFGTINVAGGLSGNTIDMEGSIAGTSTEVNFTGSDSSTPIIDYGTNDEVVFATLAGGPGTSYQDSYSSATGVLTVTEINAAGATIGSATATITGAPGTTLNSGSFVDINGPNGETIVLGSSSLANQGSIYLNYGGSATLSNTGTADTVPVTFGHAQSTLGALNVLDINGSVSGTGSPYQGAISGFGLNDDIIIGPSVLPGVTAGAHVSLSYTGSLLSVTEFSAAGASIGSTTLNVGTGYAANSFVALLGTNGVNIETPATVDETPLTFNTSGTADFETPSDYAGKLAPGSTIVAGETVVIASGTATVSASAPVTDNGTIIVSGASAGFIDTSVLSGSGVLDLQAGATAAIDAPASLSDIDMGGNAAGTSLYLFGNYANGNHVSDGPTITSFGTTDKVVLSGFTAVAGDALVSFFNTATGVLSLSEYNFAASRTDESALITIAAPGGATLQSNQVFESFTPQGLVITDIPCFASGTRILTADGQKPVESLRVGDHVLTLRDGSAQRIIWTGQRTINLDRHADPEKVRPVIILAGAFGEGLPERDLKLSPDHALFIDGHLIEAKTLVNGATILRDRAAKFVTYHHIELARHDVVLAEGLAAETYLDSGNRRNFESDAGPVALHPDFAAASRAGACATLLTDGAILRAVRQGLLDRALALGFTRTDSLDVTAKAGADVIEPITDAAAGEMLFVLPPGATSVSLACATGVPAEVLADPSDRRALGLAVTGLALIAGGRRVEIDLNDPAHQGLHAAEGRYRWTSGAAEIALPAYAGRAVLEVSVGGQAMRWSAGQAARCITAM